MTNETLIQRYDIQAFQVAQSFNIKRIRTEFLEPPIFANNSELYYHFEKNNRYLYIFDYGVVVFSNYDAVAKSEFLRFVRNFGESPLNDLNIFEEYYLEINDKLNREIVRNDYAAVPLLSLDVMQIAMLNTGQSVALEYYELLTDLLLQSTKHYTDQLEQNGDLSTSKKSLLKYIGKTINIKNSIVDNLYILDDPNVVWDSSFLDQFNRSLKTNFDTFTRFKDLDYRLKSVEENLKLFTELLQHRESSRLEWIIIILILLEFLNVLFRGH